MEDFAKVENNYLHTPLLNCNLFGYGQRGGTHFDENFFIEDQVELTLIKGACQPLPNEGHVGDFSPTETVLLEKILQCPA